MAETAKILSPAEDRDPARHGRRLQPRGQLPAREVHGLPRSASRSHRADLHQLLDRGEGAVRHHRHLAPAPRRSSPRSRPNRRSSSAPTGISAATSSRKFNREMLLWPGVCIVHEAFSETELLKLKAQHPGAPVAAHPECPPTIIDHADYVGSTSGILQLRQDLPRRHADRRDRAAHHPPDGKGAAEQDTSSARRARTATATATSAPTWR